MFLVGSIQGPIHHYFYAWMDRTIKAVSLVNVSKKVLLDQVFVSPVIILAFLYPAGLLNDQNMKQCNEEVANKFGKIYAVRFPLSSDSMRLFDDHRISTLIHSYRLTGACGLQRSS